MFNYTYKLYQLDISKDFFMKGYLKACDNYDIHTFIDEWVKEYFPIILHKPIDNQLNERHINYHSYIDSISENISQCFYETYIQPLIESLKYDPSITCLKPEQIIIKQISYLEINIQVIPNLSDDKVEGYFNDYLLIYNKLSSLDLKQFTKDYMTKKADDIFSFSCDIYIY